VRHREAAGWQSGPVTRRLGPDHDLVVAIAQTRSIPGDIDANVAIASDLAHGAAIGGASIIVFPELSLVGYELELLTDTSLWLTERDRRLDALRERARLDRIAIAVGAAVRTDDGRRLLALVIIGPDGDETIHGKVFLHGPENDVFDAAPPVEQPHEIDGWNLAFAVCFDVAVPAHAAHAAALDADAYLGSALYVEGEERRVDIHFASRAMDHRMYAVLANHAGPSPIGRSIGGSGVWSPTGERLVAATTEPGLQLVRLDAATLGRYRS
jgi:predicted amidohydrolase